MDWLFPVSSHRNPGSRRRSATAIGRLRGHGSFEVLESRWLLAVAGIVPDFALTDLNSASPTASQTISPRDYVGSISGWYFGHST